MIRNVQLLRHDLRNGPRNSQESSPPSATGSSPARSRPPNNFIKLLLPAPVFPVTIKAAIGPDWEYCPARVSFARSLAHSSLIASAERAVREVIAIRAVITYREQSPRSGNRKYDFLLVACRSILLWVECRKYLCDSEKCFCQLMMIEKWVIKPSITLYVDNVPYAYEAEVGIIQRSAPQPLHGCFY